MKWANTCKWALVEAARLRETEGLAFPVGAAGKGLV